MRTNREQMPIVTYKLVKGKDLSNPLNKGYQTRYPNTFSLPAIMKSYTVNEETGDVIVRKVRYCPMEKSIFMDEQPPDAVVKKIRFDNGILRFDTDSEPNKYKILESVDLNLSKPNRNSRKEAIFEKYDPAQKAKVDMQKREKSDKGILRFWELTDEQKWPIAQKLGIKPETKATSTWNKELYDIAQAKTELFLKYADGDLTAFIAAQKAIEYGVVTFKKQAWYWGQNEMLSVPKSINHLEALENHFEANPVERDAILKECRVLEEKAKGLTLVQQVADNYTTEEALEKGLQEGAVVWDKGYGWRFADVTEEGLGKYFGEGEAKDKRNKTSVIEWITRNPEVKTDIIARIKVANKNKV